jgi:ribosomal protein S24E
VAFMLNKVEMTTGAAFGLFAVFSILRYRTDGISTKDMTYLFLSIAIGLLTSVSKGSFIEIAAIDFTILLLTYLLENNIIVQRELTKVIQYDNINFIKPEHHNELIAKLIESTGLDIKRIVINDIDFIKESCAITVYYTEKNN